MAQTGGIIVQTPNDWNQVNLENEIKREDCTPMHLSDYHFHFFLSDLFLDITVVVMHKYEW